MHEEQINAVEILKRIHKNMKRFNQLSKQCFNISDEDIEALKQSQPSEESKN